MSCLCQDRPYQRFQGDAPERVTEIAVERADERFPADLTVRCTRCGTHWRVLQIPYGGIQGDYDWERLAAPPA